MDSIRNEEHNWKQNYAWFTIQRERNLEAKFDRKPRRTRNSSRVHRSWRELRRFERCGVFMAGHKNGRANGGGVGRGIPCNRMSACLPRAHSPEISIFRAKKKKKRDGGRREWKKNGRGRREDALGVWGKGWERKGEGGNDAIKTMASSGRRRRTESSVIVGRKIANNRGRGGWGGEIRSERVGKI